MRSGPSTKPSENDDGRACGVSITISARTAAMAAAAISGAAIACRFFGDEQAGMTSVRLLSATLAIGVVPGALAAMLCRPRTQLTALETIGFGIAISFGFVQLATIMALSLHSSPAATVGVMAVASIVMAGCVVASPSRPLSIVLALDELIVLS